MCKNLVSAWNKVYSQKDREKRDGWTAADCSTSNDCSKSYDADGKFNKNWIGLGRITSRDKYHFKMNWIRNTPSGSEEYNMKWYQTENPLRLVKKLIELF